MEPSPYRLTTFPEWTHEYVKRLDRCERSFADSVERAGQYDLTLKFRKEMSFLAEFVRDFPYSNALDCGGEVSKRIQALEKFLRTWESKNSTPGYAEVLLQALNLRNELQAFKVALDKEAEKLLSVPPTEQERAMERAVSVGFLILLASFAALALAVVLALMR